MLQILKNSKKAILTFLLITTSSTSIAGIQGFCFDNHVSLGSVAKFVKPFLLPGEDISISQTRHCVQVTNSDVRNELIRKLVSSQYKIVNNYRTHPSLPQQKLRNCLVKIQRESQGSGQNDNVGVGPGGINANSNKSSTIQTSNSTMLLGEGRPGFYNMEGNNVEIVCRIKRKGFFEMQVGLSTRDGQGVATNILVSGNERVNIGQVIDKLKRNDHKIGINSGIQVGQNKGRIIHNYYLTVSNP